MESGDLTHRVTPVTTLIDDRSGDPTVDGIVERMNALVLNVQSAVGADNGVSSDYPRPWVTSRA